jgi:hypothetical protein
MPRINSGGKFDLMKLPMGRDSAHSKFKNPNMSICFNFESIAVGVEMNRIINMVSR